MDEKALNELLECSVCLDRLDHTSKVLPCQHTFCRRCLDEIILTKRELRCPECRAVVTIKVEDLPNNILLIRLLEGIKTSGVVNKSESGTDSSSARYRDHVSSSCSASSTSQTQRQAAKQAKQPCAKAIYDYEAKENGDLALKKGDVVLLKRQLDENWYQGELNGKHGFFPANFVQVIVPLPQIPQCRALYDFDLKDEKEKDCLVFKKEDILTVIRRIDENWLEGRKGDKIGIFPLTFVELNDAAKSLVNSKISSSILQIGRQLPTASTTASQSSTSSSMLASSLPQQKRHSFTLLSSNHSPSPSPTNPQRHSCELVSSGSYNIVSTSTTTDTSSIVNSNVVALPPQRGDSPENASPRSVSSPSPSTSSTSNLTTPVYISLYNYKTAKEDELELKKGEYYSVNEKCQDGWFKGQCVKTGKIGVFPGNYVQMIRQPSAFKPINPNVMNVRATEQPSSPSRSNSTSSATVSLSASSSSQTTSPPTNNHKTSPPPMAPPPLPRTHKSSSSNYHTSPPSVNVRTSSTHNVKKSRTVTDSTTHGAGVNAGANLVAIQHSLSASSNVTPPNKVAGASGESSHLAVAHQKEKKEKKEKSSKSLVKLLGGKTKKSKSSSVSTGNTVEQIPSSSGDSATVAHVRSGSYPSNSQGASGDHKKSSSFDSTLSSKPSRPKPLTREKFTCIAPYPPQTEHELDLQVGDVVYVHKKREDGWFKGTLHRNGKTGLFPGSFVDKMD